MKSALIIHFLAGICYIAGAAWGVVEGVDYFVNKNPVNWLFLLPLLGGLCVAFCNILFRFFR
jgi:hypothetical protein